MTRYHVAGTVTISCYTVVEADSPDEAREIAEQRGVCSLGDPGQHGDYDDEVWVHSGEMDGQPDVERVEVAE